MGQARLELDVIADLNAEDDDGLGWSTLSDARDVDRVRPGAMLLAATNQRRRSFALWPSMTMARSAS